MNGHLRESHNASANRSPDGVFDHKGYTEKSLSRLVKAKAKADRAAARQATVAAAGLVPPASTSAGVSPGPAEESPAPESAPESQQAADMEEAVVIPPKEPVLDRTELLRSKPEVVGRYMQLMVPILVDVYAASVVTPIRLKTLTGLLKAISFLDADELRRVFTVSLLLLVNELELNILHSLYLSPASLLRFCRRRIIRLWLYPHCS